MTLIPKKGSCAIWNPQIREKLRGVQCGTSKNCWVQYGCSIQNWSCAARSHKPSTGALPVGVLTFRRRNFDQGLKGLWFSSSTVAFCWAARFEQLQKLSAGETFSWFSIGENNLNWNKSLGWQHHSLFDPRAKLPVVQAMPLICQLLKNHWLDKWYSCQTMAQELLYLYLKLIEVSIIDVLKCVAGRLEGLCSPCPYALIADCSRGIDSSCRNLRTASTIEIHPLNRATLIHPHHLCCKKQDKKKKKKKKNDPN